MKEIIRDDTSCQGRVKYTTILIFKKAVQIGNELMVTCIVLCYILFMVSCCLFCIILYCLLICVLSYVLYCILYCIMIIVYCILSIVKANFHLLLALKQISRIQYTIVYCVSYILYCLLCVAATDGSESDG